MKEPVYLKKRIQLIKITNLLKIMWQKLPKILKSSFNLVTILTVIVLWTGVSYLLIDAEVNRSPSPTTSDSTETSDSSSYATDDCNVAGISIHGDVVTYDAKDVLNDQRDVIVDQTSADQVVWYVRDAQKKENIKAIAVEIDSSGGSPVGGEEMMRAFQESKKPVVAFIRNRGLSAAYLAATGAQTIFASKLSDVGSIGVTNSYLQNTDKNTKEGLTFIDLSSGIFKNTGSPDKPITQDERNLLMRDIKISYEYFIKYVSQNRNIPLEKVRAIADGSTVMGEQALKDGLIDRIGLLSDVENFLTEKIDAPKNLLVKLYLIYLSEERKNKQNKDNYRTKHINCSLHFIFCLSP